MFSTLRSRLNAALGALLVLTLGLALLLHWGTQQTRTYLQRGHYAHAQLEAYLSLSLEAQRYFKRLSDWLILGAPVSLRDSVDSPQPLHQAMEQLRLLTENELDSLSDEAEKAIERGELARIDRLDALIQGIIDISADIHSLNNDGLQPRTRQVLIQTIENRINGDFRTLIDAALADERGEVRQVEQRGSELTQRLTTTATAVSITAAVLALLLGSVLFRSIKHPIDSLVAGTARLARGELGYRLALIGPTELRQLASGFNAMSAELQRQQQRLLEARADLEHKVATRTQELHDANRELKRLDQTRRQFFADISHELRTPLTVARGEAEVTLRGGDRPAAEYRTVLARVVDICQQLGRLVDDLLLMARADSVSKRTAVETFYLDELLEQAFTHGQSLARANGLNISLGLSDKSLPVRGDPQQLRQMLMIFIDNACRYSPPGQEIAMSLEQDGSDAVLVVSDSGIGIVPDDLARVFDRHYRGAQATALAPSGSGLGLCLAKSIVQTHRGSIDLSSVPDGGTTITVRLPLAETALKATACVF